MSEHTTLNLKRINYIDCDVPERYAKDIDNCHTLTELKERLSYWKPLAEDAYKLVANMTQEKFEDFRKALKLERKGKFGNNEDCCVITLPMPMFKVAQVAMTYKVPFGTALHRLMDLNKLN